MAGASQSKVQVSLYDAPQHTCCSRPAHAQYQHFHRYYSCALSPVDLAIGLEHFREPLLLADFSPDSSGLECVIPPGQAQRCHAEVCIVCFEDD